jgi:hypothetical protein
MSKTSAVAGLLTDPPVRPRVSQNHRAPWSEPSTDRVAGVGATLRAEPRFVDSGASLRSSPGHPEAPSGVSDLGHSQFGFVSYFGFRDSDFEHRVSYDRKLHSGSLDHSVISRVTDWACLRCKVVRQQRRLLLRMSVKSILDRRISHAQNQHTQNPASRTASQRQL